VLQVPSNKFLSAFGEVWGTVMSERRAFNAVDIQSKLGWSQAELDARWNETSVESRTRVKFGGGFYCAKIPVRNRAIRTGGRATADLCRC
jgi:hypothetical protein